MEALAKFPTSLPQLPAPPAGNLPVPLALWRRVWKQPLLMHYNRLIVLVLVANAIAAFTLPALTLTHLSDLILINFTAGILVRQQYVINFLFWLATRAPTLWPLSIRATLGKVYHFGGLHVGAMIAGTIFYALFLFSLVRAALPGAPEVSSAMIVVPAILFTLLLAICAAALPPIRARFHDTFELSHRLGGWTALVLFWLQTLLLSAQPADWAMLSLITASVALPWLRLKKIPIEIVCPSSHVALVKFNYGVTPFAGSSTAISRNPWREWHSFANVPSPSAEGFRLTISRAGDWTGKFIDERPTHVWVKGIPTAGVANIEVLFKRVIYVATGSGIGPCLPHLLAAKVPARLVWSTRSPRKTYGDDLVDEILAAQPEAQIWDTASRGKPDLLQLAYDAYREFGAEAVICISNKSVTWSIVSELESRGIPAFGAIWDS